MQVENKQYLCSLCNISFTMTKDHKKPMAQHSGKKTHSCNQCTMGQILKEMGYRTNQCFRAHFFKLSLFQIEIFEVWPLCSFTFESYLGMS